MPHFKIMDQTGHTTWPAKDLQNEDRMDLWRREAKTMFDKLVAEHFTPFKRPAGAPLDAPRVLDRTFDPTADDTMFVPQLVGG